MPDVTASYGTPFDFIAFLGILIDFWHVWIFKLSQIACLWYVKMPNVTAGYGRFSLIFIYYYMFITRDNFIKLLQIVCLGWKLNLCNHLHVHQSKIYSILKSIQLGTDRLSSTATFPIAKNGPQRSYKSFPCVS